jgi:signal transduction histidine kinase
MLDQLYDLARVRLGGGIAIDPAAVDARRLVQRVVEEFRLTHPERSIVVEEDGGSTHGTWDEQRLGQILSNLIGNALRHGDKQGPVRVRVLGASPSLVLEVENGGAIAPSVREQLFDPFRRGTRPSRDSLGLGLYIVRQIVVAHGGSIDVKSSEHDGTSFRVQLPRDARIDGNPVSVRGAAESGVTSCASAINGSAAGAAHDGHPDEGDPLGEELPG